MYNDLEEADAAVVQMAASLSREVRDGEPVVRGIHRELARRLCALGAGYADWRDLEMRVGTTDAAPSPTPEESMRALAPALDEAKVWDHPLAVEALLQPLRTVASDPAAWLRQTLDLVHVVQEDVTRLEAAEAVFDYIRLASDPAIGDVELTKRISLRIGMEIDDTHLRQLDQELGHWKGEGGRLETRESLSRYAPSGDDDWTRMALCGRASRIDPLVHDMETADLAEVLAVVAHFIRDAGGAVSSGHMLARLAILRPARNTWRDDWRDQIDPDRFPRDEDD